MRRAHAGRLASAAFALWTAAPAAAQVGPGYSLSVASDDRFRGQSTSDELPVATGTISFDHPSGGYAGLSLTAGPTRHDGPRLLRSVQYIGYARRLRPGLSLDAGVSNRIYTRQATVEYARRFTQFYVGIVGRRLSSRVFFSPNYDGNARSASYAELDALLLNRGAWSVTGHLGGLAPPSEPGRPVRRIEVDYRLGLARRVGRSAFSATLVGGGPDEEDHHFRRAFVLAATRSF
jgi:uncharacterized protein (TIGR02001 family)